MCRGVQLRRTSGHCPVHPTRAQSRHRERCEQCNVKVENTPPPFLYPLQKFLLFLVTLFSDCPFSVNALALLLFSFSIPSLSFPQSIPSPLLPSIHSIPSIPSLTLLHFSFFSPPPPPPPPPFFFSFFFPPFPCP